MGCMSFGSPEWQGGSWVLGEAAGLKLLKKAYDVGINTWVSWQELRCRKWLSLTVSLLIYSSE